jgi:hypothetical protein
VRVLCSEGIVFTIGPRSRVTGSLKGWPIHVQPLTNPPLIVLLAFLDPPKDKKHEWRLIHGSVEGG